MNQRITVAINREYGSGGKNIGMMLSENLGIPYYDKDILKLAADESGINEALFRKHDEDADTGLFKIAGPIYRGELLTPDSRDFTSEKNLFNYQAKIIKGLSDTESCIIVGRCADFILKGRPNVVSVFICAPKEYLMEQAAKRKSLTGRDLHRYIDKINRNQSEYYTRYTGQVWSDVHHYDLCLDSSKLTAEKCVELIKGYMKVRFDGLEF